MGRGFLVNCIFLLILNFVFSTTEGSKCGYESCNPVKDGYINVHIVPHTHDDVGWLKTVDQYYYGSRTKYQNAGVQYILDSVVDALKKDSNRRFIYVETAFFWNWWIKQDDAAKEQVKTLVNNGQLEFISGGWCMNDEAATNYQSIIDQLTWGLRKLNDTFGECGRPKVGWQIDPFGHSREMASIFARLGFDGLLLGRIDFQDKDARMATKTLEMVWRGSQNLGKKSDIFTGVMFNTYSPPKGFCFDILCSDDPMIDDKNSPDYNIDKRVEDFFNYVKNMTEVYATNNVIVTMGEDFNYQDANNWFKNLDKLIMYANQKQQNGSKYNLIYSTPSCYIKAINDETKGKMQWSVKEDDFFPYASDPHAFWTGFYTSRPTIKGFERDGNNFLQVCKQLEVLTNLKDENGNLDALREAMGVMQHHDAITGTEKEHVAHDYARILAEGIEKCSVVTSAALNKIVVPANANENSAEEPSITTIPFTTCPELNISQCQFSEENDNFIVTLYNPLSRSVDTFVKIPVSGRAYFVYEYNGNIAVNQIQPIFEPILKIPGRISNATYELIFDAYEIPAFGMKSFYVEKRNDYRKKREIRSKRASFLMDPDTGFLSKISVNNKILKMKQEFLYYNGVVGDNNKITNRSSGAYIFRPKGPAQSVTKKAEYEMYRGDLMVEVRQIFNDWVSQIIRISHLKNYIELDWIIGPIPTDDGQGKEIITRYTTEIESDSTFYTDSNGREILKRVRDSRPTWKLDLEEEIAGNYYPVTSQISIKDNNTVLAILTDRAEGGSSLKDGEIELMLHRSCLHDDAFGVGEPLIEEAFNKGLVVRGTHYIITGDAGTENFGDITVAAQVRTVAEMKLLEPLIFFSSTNGLSSDDYRAKYQMNWSGLKHVLPWNVNILTLEPWRDSGFLLRLEHIFEKEEDPKMSQPVEVDLKGLFLPFEITSVKETTLGGNQWLSENNRLQFETADNSFDNHYRKRDVTITVPEAENDFKITLNPMDIRTFIIEIELNK